MNDAADTQSRHTSLKHNRETVLQHAAWIKWLDLLDCEVCHWGGASSRHTAVKDDTIQVCIANTNILKERCANMH
jgi:hypothetical protein